MKKIQVTSVMFHGIPPHSHFNPFLYLHTIHGKFCKNSEISRNFRKRQKCFKIVFEEFIQFLKIFGKSLEMFGKFGERLETPFLKVFMIILNFADVIGNVRKCSQLLKIF